MKTDVGLKHHYLKQNNRMNILKLIFEKGKISRKDIAQNIGLTPATVTNIVNELTASGLVKEAGNDRNYIITGGGPNPILLSLDPANYFIVSVHLGLTVNQVALVSLTGELIALKEYKVKPDCHEEEIYTLIKNSMQDLCKQESIDPLENILAVGVGIAGVVDEVKGCTIWHKREHLRNKNIKENLEKLLGITVYVDSIINSLALAEYWFGKGKAYNNYLFVFVGAIIDSAIVVEGSVMKGARNVSCSLGHLAVEQGGRKCYCGKKGCLDVLASELAVVKEARELAEKNEGVLSQLTAGEEITKQMILAAAQEGDAACSKLLKRQARLIGRALSQLTDFVDFEVIFLSFTAAEEEWEELLAAYRKYSYTDEKILGTLPGLIKSPFYKKERLFIGPASIVINKLFSKLELKKEENGELKAILM